MKTAMITLLITVILPLQSLHASNDTGKVEYQSNFYQAVNKTWLEKNKIPDDKVEVTSFSEIDDKVKNQSETLISDMLKQKKHNPETKMITDFYLSFTNMGKRNKAGIEPLSKPFRQIDAIHSYDALAHLFADFSLQNFGTPYGRSVSAGMGDPTRYTLYFNQSGLSLPKKYYNTDSPEAKKKRKNLTNYYRNISILAKFDNVNRSVSNTLAVESKIAKIYWSPEKNHDIKNVNNPMSYDKLKALMSNLDLDYYFKTMQYPKDAPINVSQPSYFDDLNQLFKTITLQEWQDYLKVHLVTTFASYLGKPFEEAQIKYNISEGLNAKLEPIEDRGVRFVSGTLSMLFGKYYVEHYFDEKSKTDITKLVHSISDGYKEAITSSDRLSVSTKAKALKKIKEMTFNIGYPDKWRDYSSIQSTDNDLVQNIVELSKFTNARLRKKLEDKVVDREEWGYGPQEINAYYDPQNNKFVILAAILNQPFFDIDAADAVNYGGIGFIIGHEMGHGFDDQGSQFDEKGRLKNWWTKEDFEKFNKLKEKLIAQADKYEIAPGVYANGQIEIGEIIADLSGSEIALKRYLKIAKEKKAPRKEALQAFFKQIAKTWRAAYRSQAVIMHNDTDPHPLGEYRTNGTLKNMDAFYEAFDIKKGDAMYLAPEERVHIW